MKTSYQCEVADHIDDAGNQDKEKRRLAVTEPAEDGGQQVVGDDEENAASADADVAGGQIHRLLGRLHENGDRAGKKDHDDE